jgi:hypothetical protein
VSLRAKIVLILAAVVLAYAALDHFVQRTLVFESFIELEETAGRQDLERAMRAIDSEIMNLASDCAASAASEETYLFAAQGNELALEESILPQAFRGREHSLLFVVDYARERRVGPGARRDHARGDQAARLPAKELAAGPRADADGNAPARQRHPDDGVRTAARERRADRGQPEERAFARHADPGPPARSGARLQARQALRRGFRDLRRQRAAPAGRPQGDP